MGVCASCLLTDSTHPSAGRPRSSSLSPSPPPSSSTISPPTSPPSYPNQYPRPSSSSSSLTPSPLHSSKATFFSRFTRSPAPHRPRSSSFGDPSEVALAVLGTRDGGAEGGEEYEGEGVRGGMPTSSPSPTPPTPVSPGSPRLGVGVSGGQGDGMGGDVEVSVSDLLRVSKIDSSFVNGGWRGRRTRGRRSAMRGRWSGRGRERGTGRGSG